MGSENYRRYLMLAVVIYIVLFSSYSILRYYTYVCSAYDLGIFMQSLWTASHNQGFFFNTPEWQDLGVYTHFGVHFQPVLLPLAVVYKYTPLPEFLFIIQTLFLGIAAICLFKLSLVILEDEKKAFYIALIYLLNPLIHGINRIDFHPVSIAVPFIFMIPYYLEKQNIYGVMLSSFAVLSVKEDAGLVLISFGIFQLIRKYNSLKSLLDKFKAQKFKFVLYNKDACILVVMGIIGILVGIYVIHHYSGQYPYINGKLNRYGKHVYPGNMLIYTIITLGSVAFIPLFKPRYLVASIPLWMELYLSSYKLMLKVGYPYPYMLIPMLFVITVYTLKDLVKLNVTIKFKNSQVTHIITLRHALVFSIIWMLLFSPPIHIVNAPEYVNGVQVYKLVDIYSKWNGYFGILNNITEMLSQTKCPIATQGFIFPHIANRNNTYDLVTFFGSMYLPNNSIVLLAKSLPDYNLTVKALENSTLTANKTYYVLDINTIILDCYNQTGDNIEKFNACVMDNTRYIIEKCKQGMTYAEAN